jgi:hypothetical protein
MIGSVAICSRRTDPRLELLSTMLVSPATVFAARLVLVLSIDLVLALAASVAMHQLGAFPDVFQVVSQWLGQALLASAVGVACAVWKSPLVGGAIAATVWLLCSASTLPTGAKSYGGVDGRCCSCPSWPPRCSISCWSSGCPGQVS